MSAIQNGVSFLVGGNLLIVLGVLSGGLTCALAERSGGQSGGWRLRRGARVKSEKHALFTLLERANEQVVCAFEVPQVDVVYPRSQCEEVLHAFLIFCYRHVASPYHIGL